jgi:hypothetical protein
MNRIKGQAGRKRSTRAENAWANSGNEEWKPIEATSEKLRALVIALEPADGSSPTYLAWMACTAAVIGGNRQQKIPKTNGE